MTGMFSNTYCKRKDGALSGLAQLITAPKEEVASLGSHSASFYNASGIVPSVLWYSPKEEDLGSLVCYNNWEKDAYAKETGTTLLVLIPL